MIISPSLWGKTVEVWQCRIFCAQNANSLPSSSLSNVMFILWLCNPWLNKRNQTIGKVCLDKSDGQQSTINMAWLILVFNLHYDRFKPFSFQYWITKLQTIWHQVLVNTSSISLMVYTKVLLQYLLQILLLRWLYSSLEYVLFYTYCVW